MFTGPGRHSFRCFVEEHGRTRAFRLATIADGGVLLVPRSKSKANRKIASTSPDGATRRSKPQFHEQLWEPFCMTSIVAHPSKPGTQVFSNPHSLKRAKDGREVPAAWAPRRNLSIKLSHDNGKTWPVNKVHDPGGAAYPDLAVLQDGRVLCLYEAGNSIVCARFPIEWLGAP